MAWNRRLSLPTPSESYRPEDPRNLLEEGASTTRNHHPLASNNQVEPPPKRHQGFHELVQETALLAIESIRRLDLCRKKLRSRDKDAISANIFRHSSRSKHDTMPIPDLSCAGMSSKKSIAVKARGSFKESMRFKE
mmetsp:Transcript_16069/g.35316  ORF Transcript_16069/g.35316 Transcript_16069/m.35316 type:complete len:136 (+) Transcript_16069:233-640(+)